MTYEDGTTEAHECEKPLKRKSFEHATYEITEKIAEESTKAREGFQLEIYELTTDETNLTNEEKIKTYEINPT